MEIITYTRRPKIVTTDVTAVMATVLRYAFFNIMVGILVNYVRELLMTKRSPLRLFNYLM